MLYIPYLILMIISEILILSIFIIINKRKQNNSQLKKVVSLLFVSLFVWTFSLILQIIFQNSGISLTFFEGLASFGACFLPIFVLFLGIIFGKTKIKTHKYYILLFIIPILSTILMFTNDYHHLMYQHYSVYTGETIFGKYFPLHSPPERITRIFRLPYSPVAGTSYRFPGITSHPYCLLPAIQSISVFH